MANLKFLWLDMEMSGLDVEKEVPIEVAAIVTDAAFRPLGEYHAVIKQPQSYLDAMDDWNQRQHRATGLIDLIPNGTDPAVADRELSAFVTAHFGQERAVLSGNSISQDRLFIRRYMPLTEATLHYRMLDVTSWKIMYNGLFDLRFGKKDVHRALDDVRESIAELQFYLKFVDPKRTEAKV